MALGMTKLNNVEVASAMPCGENDITWASTAETPMNAGATEIYVDVILQIALEFHASATEDALLHIRYSADDGTTKDTEDVKTYAATIPVDAGETVIISHRIAGMFDYLDVGIENQETSDFDHTVNIDATGTKMTGLA